MTDLERVEWVPGQQPIPGVPYVGFHSCAGCGHGHDTHHPGYGGYGCSDDTVCDCDGFQDYYVDDDEWDDDDYDGPPVTEPERVE